MILLCSGFLLGTTWFRLLEMLCDMTVVFGSIATDLITDLTGESCFTLVNLIIMCSINII